MTRVWNAIIDLPAFGGSAQAIIPDSFPPGESGLATRDYIWSGPPVNSRKWQYIAEVHRCSFCGLGLLKVEWLAEVLDATSGC